MAKKKLTAHEREKAAWNARKADYYKTKARTARPSIPGIPGRTGAHVNKPWFVQWLAGYEAAPNPEPLTRQVRRRLTRPWLQRRAV